MIPKSIPAACTRDGSARSCGCPVTRLHYERRRTRKSRGRRRGPGGGRLTCIPKSSEATPRIIIQKTQSRRSFHRHGWLAGRPAGRGRTKVEGQRTAGRPALVKMRLPYHTLTLPHHLSARERRSEKRRAAARARQRASLLLFRCSAVSP